MRILQERQQVLDNLFEDTDALIHEIPKDREQYATLLEGLILQGAYALMENDVVVRCREEDVEQVNNAIDRVGDKYEENMKYRPEFTVSEDYLPASE